MDFSSLIGFFFSIDFFSLIIGAILGAIVSTACTVAYQKLNTIIHRRKPLKIEITRSKTPPTWFATDETPPSEIENSTAYEKRIAENAAFCGFAKINLHVTNKTKEVIYITDITVCKKETVSRYKYRVRTIPQGVASAIRLVACLDDDYCFMSSNISKRDSKNGNYFECGERIKIAPGETEYIFLAFVAINKSWSFNCNLKYSIHGSTRDYNRIFDNDQIIVPYIPESFEMDYCGFLERVDPKYPSFEDAQYFTAEKRNASPVKSIHAISSALEYIENEID